MNVDAAREKLQSVVAALDAGVNNIQEKRQPRNTIYFIFTYMNEC